MHFLFLLAIVVKAACILSPNWLLRLAQDSKGGLTIYRIKNRFLRSLCRDSRWTLSPGLLGFSFPFRSSLVSGLKMCFYKHGSPLSFSLASGFPSGLELTSCPYQIKAKSIHSVVFLSERLRRVGEADRIKG